MTQDSDVLWLSVSPSLRSFDQRLLARLAKVVPIQRWDYCQTLDEPCDIEAVVAALHHDLSDRCLSDRTLHPVHLLGHGVSGVVALLYARRYPERVASLTLLSVGAMPALNWQSHYYALRNLLPCSREMLLAQMTRLLFGQQSPRFTKALSGLLAQDLDSNLTLHSLAHHADIQPGSTLVPLLVCNGAADAIICAQRQMMWQDWLKAGDRTWCCPDGNHFFHVHHYPAVAQVICDRWFALPPDQRPRALKQTVSSVSPSSASTHLRPYCSYGSSC